MRGKMRVLSFFLVWFGLFGGMSAQSIDWFPCFQGNTTASCIRIPECRLNTSKYYGIIYYIVLELHASVKVNLRDTVGLSDCTWKERGFRVTA